MVILFKKKSYRWLIFTVAVLAILGLVVSMGAKLEPKTAVRPMNLQKGLVLYYSFDSNKGREITNLSGRGNRGKVRSGTCISNGKIGRAMSFDGQGDYIDIGDDSNIQTEVFSFCAWIKVSNVEEVWQPIISFENQSYAVSVLPNGRVHYGWQRVKRGGEGKSDVRTGEWVFVAVTRDSNDLASIYVDGELENSFVCDTSSKFLYSGKIGGDTIDKEYFKGSIDEVRMYNRALSPLEIKQLYNIPSQMGKSKQSKSLGIVSQDIRIEPDPNESQIKVSGVVFDEQGKPVPDVLITFLPMGGKEYVTNVKGEFAGIYSLKNVPQIESLKHRPNVYVFARCSKRNLAAAVQIPEGKERKLKITLIDAVTLTGQIIDPDGRPVVGARIDILLCDDHWRGYIDPWGRWRKDNLIIDNKGDLKIKAIPHGCFYEIIAWAEGYGEETIEMGTWDSHKKEIDIGKIILHPTNLSVSGIVVDGNSAPVPNAIIKLKLRGEGQVSHEPIKTDGAGKFIIEKLREGIVTITAGAKDFSLRGEKTVRAGEKDVEIVVEKTISVCRTGPTPPSLTGKKLPEFSGLSVDIDKEQIKDKMVLICFWDMNMQSSRHCIRKLTYIYNELTKKDIVVVSIYASEIDKKLVPDLVKKFDIPFLVGTIDGEIEDIQFKWGIDSIDSLPWCILADRDHVVADEGFGLQILRELNEGIKVSGSKR